MGGGLLVVMFSCWILLVISSSLMNLLEGDAPSLLLNETKDVMQNFHLQSNILCGSEWFSHL